MVSIGKLLIYGLVGAFAISSLINPQKAFATTQAFGGVGAALGSLGGGNSISFNWYRRRCFEVV